MQAFYAFAALYLAIALWAAHRAERQMPRRVGVRAGQSRVQTQLSIARAVLAAGLLWPERGRALLASFWDDPSIG